MRKWKQNKAITLVALVVTVIILLILAGIVISLTLGPKGILARVQEVEKNYVEASKQEQKDLEKLYSSMLVASDDNAKITISLEDLKTIIQTEVEENTKKVQEQMEERLTQIEKKGTTQLTKDCLLMDSTNNSLAVENVDLRSFDNNFFGEFSNYFEYQSSTGTIICKKEGWFMINSSLHMTKVDSSYSNTSLNIYVNGLKLQGCWGEITVQGIESCDSCSETIYLNKGDVLSFSKTTQVKPPLTWNQAKIRIIKL